MRVTTDSAARAPGSVEHDCFALLPFPRRIQWIGHRRFGDGFWLLRRSDILRANGQAQTACENCEEQDFAG